MHVLQIGRIILGCRKVAGQLIKRHRVNLTLEFDHSGDVQPVIIPTPRIKLRMRTGTQADITITTNQAQQEPDLLLSAITTARFTLAPALRNLITHPVPGASEYFYMFRHQANFFVQLAIHRLFRGLAMLNAALRKLPCMLPHPLAPKHQIPVIRDNNADIRAVAVSVYHLSLYSVNFNSRILSHFHFNEKRNNPPHLNPDGTTSHSTRLQRTAAKSLVISHRERRRLSLPTLKGESEARGL